MKTLARLIACLCIVFPLSISAQKISKTCHTGFKADTTYSCGSYLKVTFTEESVLLEGEKVTRWSWDFGDGGKSNDWKPGYQYEKPGVFTVSLKVETNFGNTYTATIDDYIVIEGNAYVNLGNDTAIDPGTTLTLDAGNPGAEYWWNTGANTRTINVNQPGEYWVHVKKGNCESRDRIIISYKEHGVNAGFVADTTYSCGSYLKVNFKDETTLEPGDFISRWSWDFGDGGKSNDWRPAHLYEKPGHYTVTLIIQTAFGYSDTVVREKYIKVEGNVFVNLGNDTAVCEGTAVELHAGNPGAQYWWSTGENTQSIVAASAGEYWVHVKKGMCEARDIIRIGEKPPVFPQFGFAMSGKCLPVNVQFTDSSTSCGVNAIVRRQWDFGDGSSSSQQHPTHNFTWADTFIVRLTVWDINGFSITRSKRVVIQPTPGAGPQVNLGADTAICETEPLVLEAGNPGATYLWSNGETLSSCVVTETGQVWVRVEQEGCVSTDTIMVTVTPSIFAKFGYSIQNDCQSSLVRFTDSSATCGVQITLWRWDFGDGGTSTLQNPVHRFNQPGEYIVRMTIYDNMGNTITRSRLVVIAAGTNLIVNLGADTAVCLGEPLTLDAAITNATYTWSTGEQTQSINIFDAGEYSVTVTKNGCTGSDTIRVSTIFPVTPALDFTITNNCLPASVKFEDKSTVRCSQRIVAWRWDFGDGTFSTEQHPVHIYTRSDSFAVRLTVFTDNGFVIAKSRRIFIPNATNCQNLVNNQIVNDKNSNTWFKNVKIKVSPNPTPGIVYVQVSKVPENAMMITVIDRFGQRVLTRRSSDLLTMLNLGNLAKGYYNIEILVGNNRKSIPIIIQ